MKDQRAERKIDEKEKLKKIKRKDRVVEKV